jgi:hypothetical protein
MVPLYTLMSVDNTGQVWLFRLNENGYDVLEGTAVSDSVIRLKPLCSIDLKKYISFPLHNVNLFNLYRAASGQIWLFTKNGLFLFDPGPKKFKEYTAAINPAEFAEQ